MGIRIYELAGELGIESRELLKRARVLGLDITSPLAGVGSEDADRIRVAVRRPGPSTVRVYELAREMRVESRDVLETARVLGLDVTSPLAGVSPEDADRIRVAIRPPRSSTVRAYELSAQLGVDSRDVLESARILGLDSTSALCSISEDDADRIRDMLDAHRQVGGAVEEPQAVHESALRSVPGVVDMPDTASEIDPVAASDATPAVEERLEHPTPGDGDDVPSGVPEPCRGETRDEGNELLVVESRPERTMRGNRNRRRPPGVRPVGTHPAASLVPAAPAHHLPSGRFHVAYLLLLATIFAIPFEKAVEIPGLGTLSKALGIAAFAAWLLGVFASGRMRTPGRFQYLFFGLGVWISLSLYWSLDTSATAGRIITFLLLFALVLVIWDLCDTPEAVSAALQAYVGGTWITAITVYYNFAQNNQIKYGRFGSEGGDDPNVTALFLAIGIPIAWYLFRHGRNRYARWINLTYLPVAVLAMSLSGSRGGFIAGSVALVYVALTVPRDKPVAFVSAIVVLIGAAVIVVALVPAESFERIGTVDESIASGDLNGRTEIWHRAWDVYVDHPLLGTGAGSTRTVLGLDKVGHNVGVTAALELGAIGAVILATIVITVFGRAFSLPTGQRAMWITVLLMWVVGSMSLDLATKKVTWLLFSLVAAAAAIAETARVSRREAIGERSATRELASNRRS